MRANTGRPIRWPATAAGASAASVAASGASAPPSASAVPPSSAKPMNVTVSVSRVCRASRRARARRGRPAARSVRRGGQRAGGEAGGRRGPCRRPARPGVGAAPRERAHRQRGEDADRHRDLERRRVERAQREHAHHDARDPPREHDQRVAHQRLRPPALGAQRHQVDDQAEQDQQPDRLLRLEGGEHQRRGDQREAEPGRRLERRAREHGDACRDLQGLHGSGVYRTVRKLRTIPANLWR